MMGQREKAFDSLEVGNYSQFQIHSREMLMQAKNGYMTGFIIVIFPMILYFIFMILLILNAIAG